jgi:hypothetical protein
VQCYKTHNKGVCQEEFAQKQIEDTLKADKVRDAKEISKMKEVLRKVKLSEEGNDYQEQGKLI